LAAVNTTQPKKPMIRWSLWWDPFYDNQASTPPEGLDNAASPMSALGWFSTNKSLQKTDSFGKNTAANTTFGSKPKDPNQFYFWETAKQVDKEMPGYLNQRDTGIAQEIMQDPRLTDANIREMVQESVWYACRFWWRFEYYWSSY
jgi:hypothetical protein